MRDPPHPDQADSWSAAADRYEQEFIDPDLPEVRNPLRPWLTRLSATPGFRTVADLGCGTGPLLPFLSQHFADVLAVDFAEGMLARARQRCQALSSIRFIPCPLEELARTGETADVAVAVNSLVMPDLDRLERSLEAVCGLLRPGGRFAGIVPAMDGVHYQTMLLLDRARRRGMPSAAARKNAAMHADHDLFDFAFGEFRFHGLVQHFWQPDEIPYRLRRAGFKRIRIRKVLLSWEQLACGKELSDYPPPWDWFFESERR